MFVPIGGGGLIGGVAYAIKSLKPDCQVIGVQAAGAPSMVRSLEQGRIITLDSVKTVADGIKVKTPGKYTFEMCQKYVDKVITVTESQIASAILTILEKQKLVAEGAGAVATAAAMYGDIYLKGKTVCSLLSAGNVDVTMLERIITRGLIYSGRTVSFSTVLPDQPRALTGILNIISGTGANILDVNHLHKDDRAGVDSCVVQLTVETYNQKHVDKMLEELRTHGYTVMER